MYRGFFSPSLSVVVPIRLSLLSLQSSVCSSLAPVSLDLGQLVVHGLDSLSRGLHNRSGKVAAHAKFLHESSSGPHLGIALVQSSHLLDVGLGDVVLGLALAEGRHVGGID